MDPEAATTDLLWALFRRIDKSRDGNISVKELNRARKSGELDITPEEAKALMRFSDEDDKGEKVLSFPAFYVASTEKKLDPRITPSILKTFTNIDMNNDGFVDRKDLAKAAEAGLQMSKKDIKALLAAADADGDKRISLTEYAMVFADDLKKRVSPQEEEVLRKQFALLDNNGDGYISKSELRKSAKTLGFTSAQLVQTLSLADMDGDGTISFEEFVSLMQ